RALRNSQPERVLRRARQAAPARARQLRLFRVRDAAVQRPLVHERPSQPWPSGSLYALGTPTERRSDPRTQTRGALAVARGTAHARQVDASAVYSNRAAAPPGPSDALLGRARRCTTPATSGRAHCSSTAACDETESFPYLGDRCRHPDWEA
ncbi:hypothetical protein LTR16_005232, partial [Cryomyces antarcticus]